jgi:Family of unknown function (DUF5684)
VVARRGINGTIPRGSVSSRFSTIDSVGAPTFSRPARKFQGYTSHDTWATRLRSDVEFFSHSEGMRMKVRFSRSLPGLSVAFVVMLMSTNGAFAQSSDPMRSAAVSGMVLLLLLVIALPVYIYMSLALQTIATKTNTENAWLAWIPIANLFLMLMIAKKPLWWFILFLIPLVNLIMAIIVWMGVAEARGKPNWLGILMIVPLANLIIPGYLAWAD